jgi:predicted DNA-binding transcriptional regulator AlpA
MGDLLVRAADAARFLGVSTRTLERWSTEGTNGLPEPVRLGSRADRYYPAKVIYAVADTIGEH